MSKRKFDSLNDEKMDLDQVIEYLRNRLFMLDMELDEILKKSDECHCQVSALPCICKPSEEEKEEKTVEFNRMTDRGMIKDLLEIVTMPADRSFIIVDGSYAKVRFVRWLLNEDKVDDNKINIPDEVQKCIADAIYVADGCYSFDARLFCDETGEIDFELSETFDVERFLRGSHKYEDVGHLSSIPLELATDERARELFDDIEGKEGETIKVRGECFIVNRKY